jgi:hypothetical protein
MRKCGSAWIGILVGVTFATPLMAQDENACLQRNRIWSWRALDESTLLYKDRTQKEYVVTFRNRCAHVTRSNATLIYRHAGSLSCLSPGDAIGVKAPGYPGSTCRVESVRAGGTP